MTTGKDRNIDWFKNWQLCGFWKLAFRQHGAIKLTYNCVCFTNPWSVILFCLPSLANITPRYLNFSTYRSAIPFTCSMHCIGFLERHNTLIFPVLIFIPSWSDAAGNRSNACWLPCLKDASSTKSSAESKRLILQLSTGHPRQLGCYCLFNSYRLWRVVTAHRCWSPSPTVNRCDLTPPTRTQMSE